MGFGEKLVRLIVSTFLIFMFVDQFCYSWMCFLSCTLLTYAKKQHWRPLRYKSLKSRKIDNIDLTQH